MVRMEEVVRALVADEVKFKTCEYMEFICLYQNDWKTFIAWLWINLHVRAYSYSPKTTIIAIDIV